MSNQNSLKIGMPSHSIIRYYVSSALFPFYGHTYVGSDYLEIPFNLKLYKDIFLAAKISIEEFMKYQNYKIDIPASGNDKNILNEVKIKLGLNEKASFMDAFKKYTVILDSINLEEIQSSLYPFYEQKGFSPPSILNIELYGYTRGPFFQFGYKKEFKLSLHQMMLSLAGYVISRCLRVKINDEYITMFAFPPSANHINKLFATQISILREKRLISIEPVEALILWLLFDPSIKYNLYLVGMKDPKVQKPAEVTIETILPLETIFNRAKDIIEYIINNEYLKKHALDLIKEATKSAVKEKKGHEEEIVIQDAVRYVKLLFLAIQNSEKEIRELLLQSSRNIIHENLIQDKVRTNIAKKARDLAESIMKYFK